MQWKQRKQTEQVNKRFNNKPKPIPEETRTTIHTCQVCGRETPNTELCTDYMYERGNVWTLQERSWTPKFPAILQSAN